MNKKTLNARAKKLRTEQTPHEMILWKHLRAKRFSNYKFKRQFIVDHYIVDFICLSKRMIIELDGSQHQENKVYDNERDKYLRKQNFKIILYWNNQVTEELGSVLQDIFVNLQD